MGYHGFEPWSCDSKPQMIIPSYTNTPLYFNVLMGDARFELAFSRISVVGFKPDLANHPIGAAGFEPAFTQI